jgi:hypothetical protein
MYGSRKAGVQDSINYGFPFGVESHVLDVAVVSICPLVNIVVLAEKFAAELIVGEDIRCDRCAQQIRLDVSPTGLTHIGGRTSRFVGDAFNVEQVGPNGGSEIDRVRAFRIRA